MRKTGTVAWFSPPKGFGFITPDGGAEASVFVHYSAIEGGGYRNLAKGSRVEFDLVDLGKGLAAKNVKRENGVVL